MQTLSPNNSRMPAQGTGHSAPAAWRAIVSPLLRLALLLTVLAAFVGAMPAAQAQTLTTLHAFTGIGAEGKYPYGGTLVRGNNGSFYGTTARGGTSNNGTVYSVTPDGTVTTLHSFTNVSPEGSGPQAGLVQGTDGNFYGVTAQGGPNGFGTVFSVTPDGTFTTLHDFTGTEGDGSAPTAALVQGTDGSFYGVTQYGGNNYGTAYKITADGTFTLLHIFTNGADGGSPFAGLVQGTDGNFYGVTNNGGANGFGTVFQMTPTGTVTTLHAFAGAADGSGPDGALVQGTDGSFYGVTNGGGANNFGTVYNITPAGQFTVLHTFTGADGASNQAALIQAADGNFYGTTVTGGTDGTNDFGTIFSITPGGVLKTVYVFKDAADGRYPLGALVPDGSGNLYGTTYQGASSNGYGSIFKLNLPRLAPNAWSAESHRCRA